MRTACRFLVLQWLIAAVLLLANDGQLPAFLAGAVSGSLVFLSISVVTRQQRAPSMLDSPPLPERYRVADDLRQPMASVVAAAEQDASIQTLHLGHRGW
jgi:hypothetical protein